jgi:uncharacterized membrane protein
MTYIEFLQKDVEDISNALAYLNEHAHTLKEIQNEDIAQVIKDYTERYDAASQRLKRQQEKSC